MLTGETSTARVCVSGDATVVGGVTVGAYLYRNSVPRPPAERGGQCLQRSLRPSGGSGRAGTGPRPTRPGCGVREWLYTGGLVARGAAAVGFAVSPVMAAL